MGAEVRANAEESGRRPSRLASTTRGGRQGAPRLRYLASWRQTRAARSDVQELFRRFGFYLERVQRPESHHHDMGDFLSIIGMVAFVVLMLGLIKGLEHV